MDYGLTQFVSTAATKSHMRQKRSGMTMNDNPTGHAQTRNGVDLWFTVLDDTTLIMNSDSGNAQWSLRTVAIRISNSRLSFYTEQSYVSYYIHVTEGLHEFFNQLGFRVDE